MKGEGGGDTVIDNRQGVNQVQAYNQELIKRYV